MATELDTVLQGLCKREIEAGCYDCKVGDINAYNLVRFRLRNYYLTSRGLEFVDNSSTSVNYWHFAKSFTQSAIQLLKLILLRKRFDVLFYPFLRLDKVGDYYLDKFTDPIIECCGLHENYIIFDRGRRGEHPTPRLHKKNVIFTNFIDVCCELYVRIRYKQLRQRYKEEFDHLFDAIDYALEGIKYDRDFIANRVLLGSYTIRVYEWLLKRMNIKKIFAPSRVNLLELMRVARRNGMRIYEFQHGITYGETALYSGYRDPDFTPDYFLAYGDTPPRDVYGIDEEKMINIGWAFQDYLKKLSSGQKIYEKGVLVISNPCTTDKVLRATFLLADAYKDIQFVVRPHPVEVVTQEHVNAIAEHENVSLQDWHINVALAMQSFDCVIGESSTVLYEALNDGKKVARFCFDDFTPEYLTPEDEECFWKVYDTESFKSFIDGKAEDKKSMKIYSKFDKELFMKLYNA